MKDEEIKKLKVKDIIRMEEFAKEMSRQISIEEGSREEALGEARLRKARLQRTPVDSLIEKGVFNTDRMVDAFEKELEKALIGFSSMERQYIHGVGMVCFGRVLAKLKEE